MPKCRLSQSSTHTCAQQASLMAQCIVLETFVGSNPNFRGPFSSVSSGLAVGGKVPTNSGLMLKFTEYPF